MQLMSGNPLNINAHNCEYETLSFIIVDIVFGIHLRGGNTLLNVTEKEKVQNYATYFALLFIQEVPVIHVSFPCCNIFRALWELHLLVQHCKELTPGAFHPTS